MDLYFSPLSCSLATRIALYEAALDAETVFHNVTLSTKRYDDDADYWKITAKGQVPALVTREGTLLTENAAVLQYVADLAPAAQLAPPATAHARYELQQWLSFVGTELHKQVFAVVFNPQTPAEAKAYVLATVLPARLEYVAAQLTDRRFLVGETFTVADAYLMTTLIWCAAPQVNVDLARWPAIADYHARMTARPQARRALSDERTLARPR
jgi:glutathione S-transferase